MTYIPTWTGFLYLAMVIDVYSRKVVGWTLGERMTSDLGHPCAEHGVHDPQAAIGDSPFRPGQPVHRH